MDFTRESLDLNEPLAVHSDIHDGLRRADDPYETVEITAQKKLRRGFVRKVAPGFL